jgi:hypothetical protein
LADDGGFESMTSGKITNEQNVYYFMNLSIGNPAQDMTFLIDSGSAWLWVPSVNCVGCNLETS